MSRVYEKGKSGGLSFTISKDQGRQRGGGVRGYVINPSVFGMSNS